MNGLIDGSSLPHFIGGFVSMRDGQFHNRWPRYVPRLMAACLSMIARGALLLTYHDAFTGWRDLTVRETREVIVNIDNWWRYDPTATEHDPDDDGVNPVPGGALGKVERIYTLCDPLWKSRQYGNYRPPSPMEPLPSAGQLAKRGGLFAEDNIDFVGWVEGLTERYPDIGDIVRLNTDPYPQMQGAWIFTALAVWAKDTYAKAPDSPVLIGLLRDIDHQLTSADEYTRQIILVSFVQGLWRQDQMRRLFGPNLEALALRAFGKQPPAMG
jgi:hypothetical protein